MGQSGVARGDRRMAKGEAGLAAYRQEKNRTSLAGLPTGIEG